MILPILSLLGAGILVSVATFTYFGGYWYELLRKKDDDEQT
jgi:hypothetical protein